MTPDLTTLNGALFLAEQARSGALARLAEGHFLPQVMLIITRAPEPGMVLPSGVGVMVFPSRLFFYDGEYNWQRHIGAARAAVKPLGALGAIVALCGHQLMLAPGEIGKIDVTSGPPPEAKPALVVSLQHVAQGRVTHVWSAPLSGLPGEEGEPVTLAGDWVDLGSNPASASPASDILFDAAGNN